MSDPGNSFAAARKIRPKPPVPEPYAGAKRGPKPKDNTPKTSAVPSGAAKKRKPQLTTYDWLNVYTYVDANPTRTQTDIVQHFAGLPGALLFDQATLSRKLKPMERQKLEARAAATPNGLSSKRDRVVTRPDVERALALWVTEMNKKNETVSERMLMEKRRRFEVHFEVPENERMADSMGWLQSFKTTYAVCYAASSRC